jgi:hypothetical protein
VRVLTKAIGLGAVALLGGGAALLVRGHAQSDPESRRFRQVQQALEAHGESLERIERHQARRVQTLPMVEVVAQRPPMEQAVAHQGAGQDPPPALPIDAPPQVEPSVEQLELEQTARDLLEGAVKAGAWRDSDREAFRGQFQKLTKLQQAGLAQTLSVAINEGKIHVDPAKMPW